LELGPYAAFKISPPSTKTIVYPEAAFTTTAEIGAVAGLRFNISDSFSLVPRLAMALTPIVDTALYNEAQQPLGHLTLYSRALEITLAWKSDFRKKSE
jgi:hypothetical protein